MMGTDGITLQTIKEIDIVGWLAGLGFEPVSEKKGFEYWYRSPLRAETEASFKVNKLLNFWYDFGLAKGGNLVDLAMRYYACTAGELLSHFDADDHRIVHSIRDVLPAIPEPQLVVKNVRPIFSYPLKNYLHERGIPVALADQYCKEVNYDINANLFYGVGFKNDAGGYEIRSKIAKSSSSPKDITTFRFGAPTVQVFEGFFDMLSWRVLHPYDDPRATDVVVLNSAALFDRAVPFLMKHDRVHLWLDRDATGLGCRERALALGDRFVDESGFYRHYKDLNEWLCQQGKVPEQRQRLKISGL